MPVYRFLAGSGFPDKALDQIAELATTFTQVCEVPALPRMALLRADVAPEKSAIFLKILSDHETTCLPDHFPEVGVDSEETAPPLLAPAVA